MIIVKNESVVPVDVDGTLILPYNLKTSLYGRKIEVYDAVTKKFIKMVAHEPNIRLLLEERSRGSYVIVWSKGGFQWATNVVQALGLVDSVDLILTKPKTYIDDLPVRKWLKDRVYLEPDTQYKK